MRMESQRPILSRVIESPDVIVARARVADLVARALVNADEAIRVIGELELEVAAIDMPARFSREVAVGDMNQAENKRQQLLKNLDTLKRLIPEALAGGDTARAIGLLETVLMDIEATKSGDPVERTETTQVFRLQGVDIALEKISLVFNPSPHGLFLGENIRVESGESVIDVGTGSGLFAILAARLGGEVSATEISREAVAMTRLNAALNDVPINVRQGPFFGGFGGNFDVLIANLPQKLMLAKREDQALDAQSMGAHGGSAGNEILLEFLSEAKDHMKPDSRLYIQVYSLTDHQATMREISKFYTARPLATREFIEDDLVQADVEGYEDLKSRGVVDMFQRDGHWYAYETAYELQLLPAA